MGDDGGGCGGDPQTPPGASGLSWSYGGGAWAASAAPPPMPRVGAPPGDAAGGDSGCAPADNDECIAVDPAFSSGLGGYCGSPAFADCVLALTDGTELPAHRIVLATRSPVFAATFTGAFEEARSCRLEIEADAAVARALLQYIYTGRAAVTGATALGLYLLADKYGFAALRAACFRHMFQHLNAANVCEVFRATQHPALADACARYFGRLDVESVAAQRSFSELPAADVARLVHTLRRVCEPCDEYLFRLVWRWAGRREERLKHPVWGELLGDTISPARLSPPTLIGKVREVVSPAHYVRLLETFVRAASGPVGPLDEEGFPASELLRYASVRDCPAGVIEAALVRCLKSRFGASLSFCELLRHLCSALDPAVYCVRPEAVRTALAALTARRYVDTDGGGYYQYRP
eukprot:TRINITY_DN51710_c0_g1_i1.p1 TRINITY_DN51710_c0_g1~~TRINITY_DN51710_c0_g1_i1.p1  ORF type:complete len:433 (+),score=144.19 TRINITY_DN51710_c0_g1_i1:80-1300(+)